MTVKQKKAASKLVLLSEDSRSEIDRWLAKYPPEQQKSAVMAALRIAQDQNGGSLDTDIMDAVAEYLDMPSIAVYEIATFYSMYELEPVGRHKICICTNISCMLRGSENIEQHLSQRLGIKLGETTSDGRITLKEVECLGACVEAPMLQIGDTYYGNLNEEKIDQILDNLD